MRADRYRDLALATVVELLLVERAVVWTEVEARLSDRRWGPNSVKVDPHHLTYAKRMLLADGTIVAEAAQTRGGRAVETYSLAESPRRATAEAAARKRLLQARFQGWATGTKRHPRGLIGGAGERTMHASLSAAAGTAGYHLVSPKGGDIDILLGQAVPVGPLDGAAHLLLVHDGVPTGVATLLIEVKNIREWIYPNSTELFQLLHKGARVQQDQPDQQLLPVLVCRRTHPTTVKMATALGFYVVDAKRQFLTPSADVTDKQLEEVRHGLGYVDLVRQDTEDTLITNHFASYLPKIASALSTRWSRSAPVLGDQFERLWKGRFTPSERSLAMETLRESARSELGDTGGW